MLRIGYQQRAKITITATTGLKDEEIERMVEEAAKHADEDKKKKERIEKRNNADSLCFNIEKLLKENGEKIDDDDKEDLRKVLKK